MKTTHLTSGRRLGRATSLILGLLLAAGSTAGAETGAGAAPLDETPREHSVERRPVLMGTMTRMVVTGAAREDALATTASIERILRAAEDDLSTWRAGTELDRFHRAPLGRGVELSIDLDRELSRALECAEATDGAFDPTLGALTAAWDLRGQGRTPRDEELEDARRRSGRHHVSHDNGVWRRHREILIDEGGFGKGAALDRVRKELTDLSSQRVFVDLGGQLLLVDANAEPRPWRIEVADPDDRSQTVLALTLAHGSVATSANSERAVGSEQDTIGHLLDPRTGKPAADFGSVTVWAPTALEADCLATGLFVAGPDAALDFAARHSDIEVLVIERHQERLSARASDGWRERIEVVSQRISFQETPRPQAPSQTLGAPATHTVPRPDEGLREGDNP